MRLLADRLIEAARALRKTEQQARKWESRHRELSAEMRAAEERVELLERMQRVGMEELERELCEKIALVDQQRAAILALSAPILQVAEHVLALPIQGDIDDRRADVMTRSLLESIVARQALFTVVDLTGVESVDAATADRLARLLAAAKLIGARPVVTGLRPMVARTMVAEGLDLSTVHVERNLQQALRFCGRALREEAAR
jgi:anti-anti-sigma factor